MTGEVVVAIARVIGGHNRLWGAAPAPVDVELWCWLSLTLKRPITARKQNTLSGERLEETEKRRTLVTETCRLRQWIWNQPIFEARVKVHNELLPLPEGYLKVAKLLT